MRHKLLISVAACLFLISNVANAQYATQKHKYLLTGFGIINDNRTVRYLNLDTIKGLKDNNFYVNFVVVYNDTALKNGVKAEEYSAYFDCSNMTIDELTIIQFDKNSKIIKDKPIYEDKYKAPRADAAYGPFGATCAGANRVKSERYFLVPRQVDIADLIYGSDQLFAKNP